MILMVAITVILAAVIAAFVFGLAGTTGSSKNVGLTVVTNGSANGFDVTIQGGTDLPTLENLEWSTGGTYDNFVYLNGTDPYAGDFTVGERLWTAATANNGVKLTVRGTFNDGSQQVLFDRQY
ncbi:MAG TPA: type IV pilin N-terminal domain-containing protein [Methanoregulaceae archaeon]|nr:type IV pilin N-terminal domain-containing protein [Methanoregulaceae archaeon]